MKRLLRFLLVVAFVMAGGAFVHSPAAARDVLSEEYDACPVADGADGTYTTVKFVPTAVFYAGDTIEISAEPAGIPGSPSLFIPVASTIYLNVGGVQVDTAPLPGTLSYTFTEDTTLGDFPALEWGINFPFLSGRAEFVVIADWTVSCSNVPLAGCDALMNIPSTAVVGAFVADAALYWEPGQLVQPHTGIAAGNTAWVLGKDASGEYYKIIWVCDLLWVPVSTMGPNYDAVWNGTPLPADVVD